MRKHLFFITMAFLLMFGNRTSAVETIYQTRAVWIPAGDFATPEKADAVIKRSADSNLNTLLPQVLCNGYASFKSSFFDMDPGAPKGFDPLGYLLEKAHAAGLEVHPWFCVSNVGNKYLEQHPEFKVTPPERPLDKTIIISENGDQFANVHNADFRDAIINVMMECVKNYKIDGLHYDYIRAGTTSFDANSLRDFEKEFGKSLYAADLDSLHAWHASAVDDIVFRATQKARAIRPGVIISAAVFSNVPYVWPQGQDAKKWVKNGWIDLFFTMNYEMSAIMVRTYEQQYFVGQAPPATYGVGLATYMEDGKKGYASRPAKLVMSQMNILRDLKIRHIAFFSSSFQSDEIVAALTGGPFKQKAVPAFRNH